MQIMPNKMEDSIFKEFIVVAEGNCIYSSGQNKVKSEYWETSEDEDGGCVDLVRENKLRKM
jgi:hypothetical protein